MYNTKGISPIVAVVLLIAIAVIAAVGLYFWVGGLATQQPTTAKPGVITSTCQGGTVLVTNIGTSNITAGNLKNSATTLACAATATNNCGHIATFASGGTCVCETGLSSGTSGSVYASTVGSAKYNC
jgi:flagellin-like protein